MVHSEFPVERLVQLASNQFQMGFARQAMRVLHPSDRIAFEATGEGLLMRAQNEDALDQPLTLLCDLYGDDLKLLPPQVRCMNIDGRIYEPVMLLRVRTEPRHLDAVRSNLTARKLKLLEEHVHPSVCVLRAEGPLRNLLGYGEALATLSEDKALHWIWLDRYVPLDDPPGGQAA